MNFVFIDGFFALIMLVCAVSATVKGFLHEFFSKLAFLLGIFTACYFYRKLSPYLSPYIQVDFICRILAFVIIFILVYLVVRLIQQAIKGLTHGDVMSGLDHALGFLFGLFEGLVFVSLILIVFYSQPWVSTEFLRNSFFSLLLENFLSNPSEYVKGIVASV